MTDAYQGRHLFLDACLGEGADVMFGNPGTSEVPIMDALNDRPRMRYVLCLHEAVAVTAADAHAHLTGRVGLVNLHIGPGLGNAIGSIYNAFERDTPLVITCGQTDTRMRLREPLTHHDLVAMAAPVTRWAVQCERIEELPLIMARAFKTAREAPGPVFVSLPVNLMDEPTALTPQPATPLARALLPPDAALARAAEVLARAQRPAIAVGDRVARGGAVGALVALAERLGAPVFAEALPAWMNIPFAHPHFVERLSFRADLIRNRLAVFDALVLVGGEFVEESFYAPGPVMPEGVDLVHVDVSPHRVGRNFPATVGLVGDIAAILADLAARVPPAAPARLEVLRSRKSEELQRHRDTVRADMAAGRLSPAVMLDIVARLAPEGAHIASEVHLSTPHFHRALGIENPAQFLSARAGGIGQAFPSAVGAQIAMPDRKVIAVSGDGSALYTPQALWTAAHLKLPITFVVLDNRCYDILAKGMGWYRDARGISTNRPVLHFDLSDPAIDFAAMARAYGVAAATANTPEGFEACLREAIADTAPRLIHALVVPGR